MIKKNSSIIYIAGPSRIVGEGLAMNDENFKEKDYYKEKIIEMVEKINNQELLESIYWFVKTIFDKFNK